MACLQVLGAYDASATGGRAGEALLFGRCDDNLAPTRSDGRACRSKDLADNASDGQLTVRGSAGGRDSETLTDRYALDRARRRGAVERDVRWVARLRYDNSTCGGQDSNLRPPGHEPGRDSPGSIVGTPGMIVSYRGRKKLSPILLRTYPDNTSARRKVMTARAMCSMAS